jgi:zinc and cadmium transporter
VAFGLSIHTIIDGLILAGSVAAEASEDPSWKLFGLGTFLVIVLHKPFDAMSISSLMARGGWSVRARHIVNACFAMMVPIGIGLFFLGQSSFEVERQAFVGCVLAFAAGNFLCISLSDLLPELQFHHHDRLKLSAALLLGIGMAYGLVFLESHGHEHHAPPAVHSHDGHQDHGHDHSHDGHKH